MRLLLASIVAAVATILACQFAHAAPQIELGVGISRFQSRGDCSTWVQCARDTPYTDHLTSPSLKLGLTDEFAVHGARFRWHAGWEYLGKVSVNAIAHTGPDFDYSYPLAGFNGQGDVRGFYFGGEWLRAAPFFPSWQMGIGLGGYIYKPSWIECMTGWRSSYSDPPRNFCVSHKPTWQNTPTLTLSLSKGANEFSLQYLFHVTGDTSPSNPYPPYYDVRRVTIGGHQLEEGMFDFTWERHLDIPWLR